KTSLPKATQARPPRDRKPVRSAPVRSPKPKSELAGPVQPASDNKAAGANSADAPLVEVKLSVSKPLLSKPSVAKPDVAKAIEKAIDMTPADAQPGPDPKPMAVVPSPPAQQRRRMIDVAAVIDRALQAAGLK
ncbi:MAG: hypothetical protein WA418_19650, partial [Bradyrhizobium sp.]